MHIEKVKDSLLSMLHPAGFKMFNEVSMIKGFHVGNKLIDSSIEGVVDVISNLTASITPYATTNSELTVTLNNIFAIPGPDIAAICQNNLTLYVELIGETAGHIFLWEQISGNEVGVNYLTPTNGTSFSYQNNVPPGTRDDKVFRFWIDKGTEYQQYADITVYGTPTSRTAFSAQAANDSNQSILSTDQATAIYATMVQGKIYNFSTEQYIDGLFLEWNLPTGHVQENFIEYVVQKHGANGWVDHQVNMLDTRYTFHAMPVEKNVTYRVLAKYRTYQGSTETYTLVSNNAWWIDDNIYANEITYMPVTKTPFIDANIRQSEFTSGAVFTVKNQAAIDDVGFYHQSTNTSLVSDYQAFTVKVQITPSDEVAFTSVANKAINTTIDGQIVQGSIIGEIGNL